MALESARDPLTSLAGVFAPARLREGGPVAWTHLPASLHVGGSGSEHSAHIAVVAMAGEAPLPPRWESSIKPTLYWERKL